MVRTGCHFCCSKLHRRNKDGRAKRNNKEASWPETMWCPCGNYVVSTWKPSGVHVINNLFPYIEITWCPRGNHVVFSWAHGFQVDTAWFPCGHHVASRWKLDLFWSNPLDRYQFLTTFYHFHITSVAIRS